MLTSVIYPGPVTENYTYGWVGNRLTKTGVTGGYTYDIASQMLTAGGVSYGYDSAGNLTSRGSDSFAWNHENRMTTATVAGTTTTFTYNGDGLRNSRTVDGVTATFTWDINAGVPQILDDGTFKFVFGLGRICEIGPGTTTHYYLTDGLGSTMKLVDSSGAVANAYEYDVFGGLRSQTWTVTNEYKFVGEQVDPSTSLRYLRDRYYEQGVGRFLSRDPLGGGYPYVANNPVNLIDPTGLHHIQECGFWLKSYVSVYVGVDDEGNDVFEDRLDYQCLSWYVVEHLEDCGDDFECIVANCALRPDRCSDNEDSTLDCIGLGLDVTSAALSATKSPKAILASLVLDAAGIAIDIYQDDKTGLILDAVDIVGSKAPQPFGLMASSPGIAYGASQCF